MKSQIHKAVAGMKTNGRRTASLNSDNYIGELRLLSCGAKEELALLVYDLTRDTRRPLTLSTIHLRFTCLYLGQRR